MKNGIRKLHLALPKSRIALVSLFAGVIVLGSILGFGAAYAANPYSIYSFLRKAGVSTQTIESIFGSLPESIASKLSIKFPDATSESTDGSTDTGDTPTNTPTAPDTTQPDTPISNDGSDSSTPSSPDTTPPSSGSGSSSGGTGKPTDASTGPRKSVTSRSGGTLTSGTYSGVRFTGNIEIPAGAGPVTLTDCVIDGTLSIKSTNLVIVEYCDVNGWFGHRTDNKDKNKQLLIVRHSKFTGPTDNDAVRLGNTVGWSDNSTYQNVLIEDTIFHSPFSSTDPSAHFDLLQFGGGNNYTFNRVAFSFIKNSPAGVGVAYINNDTQNGNVIFNNIWLEGGTVTYTFRGPMTVNGCVVESSTAKYGIRGGSPKATLNNCVNESGVAL